MNVFSILSGLVIASFFVMWWFNRLPSIESLEKLMDIINTRGGNICLLLAGTILGCGASLRLFYYIIQLSVDGKIQQDNVFGIMSLTFVTGTVTGGFQGALLKTMTGEKAANSETKP